MESISTQWHLFTTFSLKQPLSPGKERGAVDNRHPFNVLSFNLESGFTLPRASAWRAPSGEQQSGTWGLRNAAHAQRWHGATPDSLRPSLTSGVLPRRPWVARELLTRNPPFSGLCGVSYHRPWGWDIFSKHASRRWPIALHGLLSWAVSLLIILECQSMIYSKNAVRLEQLDLYCIEHAIRQWMSCLLTSFIASFQLYWSENYENPYLLWSIAASDQKLVLHVHVPYVRTVSTEMSSLDLKWLRELWMGRRRFCSFPLSWLGKLHQWQLDCRSSVGVRCCKLLWLL